MGGLEQLRVVQEQERVEAEWLAELDRRVEARNWSDKKCQSGFVRRWPAVWRLSTRGRRVRRP